MSKWVSSEGRAAWDSNLMMRHRRILLVSLAGVVAGSAYLAIQVKMKQLPRDPASDAAGRPSEVPLAGGDTSSQSRIVHLYFADKQRSHLVAEERALYPSDDPAEFGRSILGALIEGPRQEHMPTLPSTIEVRGFFVTPEGVAYVDLSDTVRSKHPGGSETELFSVFSIVNTLVLNIPEIKMVKLLVGGSESDSLAGHIDLRSPFKADMLMIR